MKKLISLPLALAINLTAPLSANAAARGGMGGASGGDGVGGWFLDSRTSLGRDSRVGDRSFF